MYEVDYILLFYTFMPGHGIMYINDTSTLTLTCGMDTQTCLCTSLPDIFEDERDHEYSSTVYPRVQVSTSAEQTSCPSETSNSDPDPFF